MIKILIGSHGKMASGAVTSLQVLIGDTKNITAVDAYVDNNNPEKMIEAYMDTIQEEEPLFMISDIPGGSVNHMMMKYAGRPNTYFVTGFNLALLMELSLMSGPVTEEKLDNLIDKCRRTMVSCTMPKGLRG